MRLSSLIFSIIIVALVLTLLPTHSLAAAKVFLTPQPINTFDGVSWSGLSLGELAQGDIRKAHRTGRGIYDSSVEMSQPKGAPMRIYALFASHSKADRLNGIAIQFQPGREPSLDSFEAAGEEQDYYLRGRLEDWKIATFPKRGIVLFVLSRNGMAKVVQAVLVMPAALRDGISGLTTNLCPVEKQVDPNAGKPKIAEFGGVSATFDVQGIAMPNAEKQQSDIESQLKAATARGTLRYQEGATGSYNVTITVKSTNGVSSESVSAEIDADGPYGPASGSSTIFLPSVAAINNIVDYSVALLGAREEAEKQFAAAIRAQGPPTLEEVRTSAWTTIFVDLRKASAAAVGRRQAE